MKINPFLSTLLLTGTCLFASCQKQTSEQPQPVTSKYNMNFVPAKTNNEFKDLSANLQYNIIRTPEDLDAIIAAGKSPLAKLPATSLEEFKRTISYRPGSGIAGLSFLVLKEQLKYDDFAEVMASFGFDIKQGYWGLSNDPKIMGKMNATYSNDQLEQPADDYDGYKCTAPYTCEKTTNYICTSNCK